MRGREEAKGRGSKLCLSSLACKFLLNIDLHVSPSDLFVCLFVCFCFRLSAAAWEAASQLYALTQLINQVKKSLSMQPMSLVSKMAGHLFVLIPA